MKRAIVALVLVALAAPGAASAHATLLRTQPANGAVLAHAPHAVLVVFDDAVRVAGGNAAVANDSGASIVAGRARTAGRTLTIPLRPGLGRGDYSVRWSIVSDDGHREVGVLAFAIGPGRGAPQSILSAHASLDGSGVVLRTLWYLGLLVAGGAAALGLLPGTLDSTRQRRPLAHLLFFALLLAFLGGSGLVHGAVSGTRYANVLDVALAVTLVGATAAALAPGSTALLRVAEGCALALLVAPTLSGHALDRRQPPLAPLADLAHLASAAVWLGGLVWLIAVVPRATDGEEARRAAARRFSSIALVSVVVLGATGILRALTELGSVRQIWSTSYGETLLVKTGLFVALLAVGWLNRTLLLDTFVRLRRSVRLEILGIAVIVVAVAVLTQLRPGRDAASSAATAPLAGTPPALPPRDAVVAARELGTLAVAVARGPGRTTVTLVGPDADGADGHLVLVDGRPSTTCGSGCYRAPTTSPVVRVTVDGRTLAFDVPARAPDATALLAAVTRAYRAQRSIAFTERLGSTPTNAGVTRFDEVAPDRLGYVTVGGPQAVVIGSHRWDRSGPDARWVASPQTPLIVPQPYWHTATNVHVVAPRTLTFLDRSIPAWFRVTLGPRANLPRRVAMTAAAHFMVDSYSRFGGPLVISAPASR